MLLAAALRIAWYAELRDYELRDHLQLDPKSYHSQAEGIRSGKGPAPGHPYYQAPLYPYFLAALYSVGGVDFDRVRAVQMLLGVLSLVIVAEIGALTVGRGVGLVAALAGALYAPFPFYEAQIMKTTLGLFLALAGLYAALRSRESVRWVISAGLLLGLASLVRENLLLLIPGAALALWWGRRSGDGSARQALLLLAGAVIAVAPVSLRNLAVSGEPILVTSQGGQNFYIGNNELARGVYTALPFVRPDPEFEQVDFRLEAERRTGRELSPAALSRFWFAEGFRWIAGAPGEAARLFGTKFLLFWNDLEVPDNENFYYMKDRFRTLRLMPLTFGAIAPFALLGMITAARRFRRCVLLYLAVGVVLVPLVAFFIFSRYRLGAVPFLLLFAGEGAVALWGMIAARHFRAAVVSLLLLTAGWAGANRLDPIGFDPRVDGYIPLHVNRAMIFVETGDPVAAITEYKLAAGLDPGNGVIHKKMAGVYRAEGMWAEAEEAMALAVSLLPNDASLRNDLALILLRRGETDRAEQLLREAIRLDPAGTGPRRNLDRLLEEKGR